MMNEERKLVRIGFSFDFLFLIIRQDFETKRLFKCVKGLPDNAVFVSSYLDDQRQIAFMIFSHENFDPVKLGEIIPEFQIIHEEKVEQENYEQ